MTFSRKYYISGLDIKLIEKWYLLAHAHDDQHLLHTAHSGPENRF